MASLPPREQLSQYYKPVFEAFKKRYPGFEPLSAEVFISLIRTGDQFRGMMERRCRRKGLTGPAFGILNLLDTCPEGRLSMRQISQRMLVTPANMTGLVDTLEKQRWVRRTRDSKDRRVTWIEITAKGREKLESFRPEHLQFVKKFLSDFSAAEKKNLINLLGKIRAAVFKELMVPALILPLLGANAFSLSLGEAARQALQNSPEVKTARADYERARLEEPSLLALTDPVLSLSGSQTDDRAPRSSPAFQGTYSKSKNWEAAVTQNLLIGTEAQMFFKTQKLENPSLFRPIDPTATSSIGFTVRQPLLRYFWGRPDKAKRRQARSGVAAAQANWERAKELAAARASFAFVELFVAQKNMDIRRAALEDAKRLLAKYEEKRRYGLVESSDLLQAKVSVNIQETEFRAAQTLLTQADESLRQALYLPDGQMVSSVLNLPPFPQDPVPEPETALKTASEMRGDWQASKKSVERAEHFVRVEKLNTLPDLALFGTYEWDGLDSSASNAWRKARTRDYPIYTTGVSLSIAFGQKSERLRRKEARLQLASAQAENERLRAAMRQETNNAIENLRLAKDRTRAYETLLDLEHKKLKAAEEDFQRGRSNTDQLIRFQGDIHRAQGLLLRAQADELSGWAQLSLATGTLLEQLSKITGEPIHD